MCSNPFSIFMKQNCHKAECLHFQHIGTKIILFSRKGVKKWSQEKKEKIEHDCDQKKGLSHKIFTCQIYGIRHLGIYSFWNFQNRSISHRLQLTPVLQQKLWNNQILCACTTHLPDRICPIINFANNSVTWLFSLYLSTLEFLSSVTAKVYHQINNRPNLLWFYCTLL